MLTYTLPKSHTTSISTMREKNFTAAQIIHIHTLIIRLHYQKYETFKTDCLLKTFIVTLSHQRIKMVAF